MFLTKSDIWPDLFVRAKEGGKGCVPIKIVSLKLFLVNTKYFSHHSRSLPALAIPFVSCANYLRWPYVSRYGTHVTYLYNSVIY